MECRNICARLDITHQAHFITKSKLWIWCHMCANQQNNIIFEIFEGLDVHQTRAISVLKHIRKISEHLKYFFSPCILHILNLCVNSLAKLKLLWIRKWCSFWCNWKFGNINFHSKSITVRQQKPWSAKHEVWRLHIDSKIRIFKILFWFAHIWHEIHILDFVPDGWYPTWHIYFEIPLSSSLDLHY